MAVRVFLVDDEVAIREGIRNSRIWEDGAFTLVGEAPDGEIALSMIGDERPDIVLTDVRMPFMDGMQLAEELSRQMPWIEIMILSGYDEFEYARKAMSLGVQEYLLKPISAAELRAALERAAERLRRERTRSERAESLRRRLAGGSRFMKEKVLSSVLSEPMGEKEEKACQEQMRALGIDLVAPCYIAEDISWEDEGEDLSPGRDAVCGLADSAGGAVHACSGRHGSLALVLGADERDAEERAYAFARSALGELERMGCRRALVSVGDPVPRLGLACDSARSARHIRHILSAAGRDAGFTVAGSRDLSEEQIAPPEADVRPLYERLQYAEAGDAERILAEYAATLDRAELHSVVVDSYLTVEALMTASRILREAGGKTADLPEAARYERMLTDAEGRANLDAAAGLLRCALEYRDARRPGRGGATLARARAYLAQHFDNPSLMLRDVAEYVGMSDSRFSAVFAQQMGITFTEHLTALRIGKAKELLAQTEMRASQIAQAVGYNDPHYFSYLFRKHTGMTASDYRRGEKNPTESGEF